MWGAAVYGLLGGLWMFVLDTVAPQPAGSVVLWDGSVSYLRDRDSVDGPSSAPRR